MADFSAIKTEIQTNIDTNGNQEITGAVLQETLLGMVDATEENITELESELDYLICETPSSTWVKEIVSPNFILAKGGSIKIKFIHHNEAQTVYLNINSTGQYPINYNGEEVGWYNSWDDGEVCLVFYDGESYQAYPLSNDKSYLDISLLNNSNYANLSAALSAIPVYRKTSTHSVSFIDNTNKKRTYICTNPNFTADVYQWIELIGESSIQDSAFKKTDFIYEGVVRENGTITDGADIYYYAKRKVKEGDIVCVQSYLGDNICLVSFWDDNNAIIDGTQIMGNYSFDPIFATAPANAAWVYVSIDKTRTLYPAYYAINYITNKVTPKGDKLAYDGTIYNAIQDSSVKKTDFINEGCVRENGTITDGADIYYYAKRKVKEGDRIYANINTAGSICAICFKDNNDSIIADSIILGTYAFQTINTVAPINAAWVYISTRIPYIEDSYYIVNDIDVDDEASAFSFSKRCFEFGEKAPKKPCVTITFDVLKDFSFGAEKGLFEYIELLKKYGVESSSFFIRPTEGQIDSVFDFVKASQIGQDICIHSIHTDSFGDNDTENPHPTLSEAEVKLQNYQKWFKANGFPYSMGWVTSRGLLYEQYLPLLEKYVGYGHTLSNRDIHSVNSSSELYQYINGRSDDKMQIVRIGLDINQEDGNDFETKLITIAKDLIDKTIETNGFLCLYGHGFDNMDAPYTMRESVLIEILSYLKTKIDNFEILVGAESEIVPYFYNS